MQKYLFVYNPTETIAERAREYGTVQQDWEDETLYALDETPFDDDELSDWLYEIAQSEVIVRYRELDKPNERVFFEDMYDDSPVADIITKMSPGGDIRKYTNDLYGLGGESIDCSLGYTSLPQITGFEPFPMWAVEELRSREFCERGMEDSPWYPSGDRILRWADVVHDEFGLRCGALGTIHFDDWNAGFDGFVIYGADEEVRDWAAERWTTNPDDLYMRPDEFDLREFDTDAIDADSALRIWFD